MKDEYILKFIEIDKMLCSATPLIVVPTSFAVVTEEELQAHGVNVVIYANQLTRSAVPAMQKTAESILRYHRAKEADANLMTFSRVLTLIDEI